MEHVSVSTVQQFRDTLGNATSATHVQLLNDLDVLDTESIGIYQDVVIDGSACSPNPCKIYSSTTLVEDCGWVDIPLFLNGEGGSNVCYPPSKPIAFMDSLRPYSR